MHVQMNEVDEAKASDRGRAKSIATRVIHSQNRTQ